MLNNRKHLFTVLTVTIGMLAFAAGPAWAANDGHGLVGSFGSETSSVKNGEPLSDPTGTAWSAKTNEIYVVDTGNDRVERFNVTGTYEGQFDGSETPAQEFKAPNAIAVDNDPTSESYGDVYVSDTGHNVIDKFEDEGKYTGYQLTGTAEGVFSELSGVTVDPSGNLWVASGETLSKFDGAPNNNYVKSVNPGVGSLVFGIATDSTEGVYVISSFFDNAIKYSVAKEEVELIAGISGCKCVTGVGVDPVTNSVYLDQGTTIQEYAPFGEPNETRVGTVFGSLTAGGAITISDTHLVYVADSAANDVDIFEEGPKPAVATIEKAGTTEGTSAELKGKLQGGEESYRFAYNTNGTCEAGKSTPPITVSGNENVSERVTGLTAKTTYTYCLLSENKYGYETSTPETFQTTASPPVVESTSATVNLVQATLSANVNPELENSTCVFQYGKNEHYEHETKCDPETLKEGITPVLVTASLTGLEPDTTYDYRLLATNNTGHQGGPNETFTTEVITPIEVETAPANEVTATSARLGGQVNPQGGATYYVEYGSPSCSLNGKPNYAWWLCASKAAEAGPLSGNTLQQVTPIQVVGLTPGTTYKYWIVATNKNGTERGEEMTFTTPALPTSPPLVLGVTPTTIAPQIIPPVIVPTPKVTITAASVKGNTLLVSVHTTVAGTITITGTGLPKTTKTLAAGTHQVTISLKNRNKQSKHKKITVQVTLKAAGKNATATRTVKL